MKDMWRALERTIIAAFTTRNTIPFLTFLIFAILAWKLPASDIKEIIFRLLDSHTVLLMGWGFWGVTFFGAWKIFQWQENKHEKEIERLKKTNELALKGQLELPLTNGKEKP